LCHDKRWRVASALLLCHFAGMTENMTRVAITQMQSRNDWNKNCDAAEALVRQAAKAGAQLVLLQELFDADYFCIEQHIHFLSQAEPLDTHRTVKRFANLAKELGVVLPISVFERAGQVHYNTTVIVDADGTRLGHYRKSHIPDGPGYQEKFYFVPGDTGFKVWDTAVGCIGLLGPVVSGMRARHGFDGSGDVALSHGHWFRTFESRI
jgi:N-carbamoylputrescine amidase